MALSTAITYNDAAMREDLLNVLTDLSPLETQLISGLGTSSASSIRHEYLMDALTAVKDNAQTEGADATYHGITDPTRLYNYCQIFKQGYKVSETERAVNTAAFDDRLNYEKVKALKMLKNDMEYAVVRGSLASGQSNVARRLAGIKVSLSLLTSASGISMTETHLNDFFQTIWDNTATQVNAVYGDMYMKRKISAFTGGATKNVSVVDRRLISAVDIYEADAAQVVKLFAHRYISISGTDTNHDLLSLNEDYFKIAYLRKPEDQVSAKAGDWSGGNMVTEMTLEIRHPQAGHWAKLLL